jgi:hypothetical protein
VLIWYSYGSLAVPVLMPKQTKNKVKQHTIIKNKINPVLISNQGLKYEEVYGDLKPKWQQNPY